MKTIRAILTGCALLSSSAPFEAATITWQNVQNISSASDVSTEGDLVEAFNACGTDASFSSTINGVPFEPITSLLSGDASIPFYFDDTGDFGYNQLLNSLDYGSETSFQVGAGSLEIGKSYLVQLWYLDQRGPQNHRRMQFGDGNGNLSGAVNDQYVIGTFKADATSQTIIISGLDSGPHFNAYQLRKLETGPIPTLSATAGDSVSGSFDISLSFTKEVSGLELGDFSVSNGIVSQLDGSGSNWTVTITPTANGDVLVYLPAETVLDAFNEPNPESNTIRTTYVAPSSDQPQPTLTTASDSVADAYQVQINFSEDVTGLALENFDITGGTLSNLVGSGSSYSITVTPGLDVAVTLSLPRHTVTDTDGDNLQNTDSNVLVSQYTGVITVDSLAALKPFLSKNNVTVKLAPGTYRITGADVLNGLYSDSTAMLGRNHKILLKFSGNDSTYDFTGVTLEVDSSVWRQDYGNNGVYQVQTIGNYNVLKNLTMVDIGTVDDFPVDGCVNVVMDGAHNRIEGFHMTIKGSYPYGYGDVFGKGGPYTIKHFKHSAFLIRGESNHAKNCTLIHRSYGHAMFMQAANNPIIEGCYIEGEMRSTDDMLAETSGPAFDIDFETVWGFRLPPGYMKSTGEGGIRAYNAGETIVDGVEYSRGTTNPTIINNTIVNMRTGVTLTHARGTKYVAGCTTIGCERGYAIGSGIIENCSSDAQYGPAFGVDYESDRGVTADITILPYEGKHYNGSRHLAYIYGSYHNLTFRGLEESPDPELQINVGGDKRIESSYHDVENLAANNIVINNLSGYPIVFDDNASDNRGKSIGPITDAGANNAFATASWDLVSNLAFYGTASQSSTFLKSIASLATDQSTSGALGDGSLSQTEDEDQPWWRIDLDGRSKISDIRIWGRTDCCSEILSNYDVSVLDEHGQPVWTNYQANHPAPMVELSPEVVGHAVLIQLRGSGSLNLAEVEIIGSPWTRLDEWRFANFGSSENAGIAADDFDADSDGILNLLEYATGSDPNAPQGSVIEVARPAEGTELEVRFNRVPDPDLNYTLEGTEDLAAPDWQTVWTGTGAEIETVSIPESLWPDYASSYFLRLRVNR
ncbi:Ig-like domain-containing protein [Pelagicoccus sp. SDUM812005]|uniref:Ig-like domain-containing protein n=1 Tax=Pelagicoccus sp. SDUM812005 TaxID=3041257 RepID=UPI00280CEC6B|nr:Ig-like domain-containing protein [Pelagicoccus sp. SDUM812005]MDQ8182958.1 Ig-like domain-containing protein [Pelagicoccus sp. SDUM812005]